MCECVSYSQYCSLGLCSITRLAGGHVLFSRVQLVRMTPLTLQMTRKVQKQKWVIIVFQALQTCAVNQRAPDDTSVQLLSAQLEQPVHGKGDWKEANM